MNYISLILLNVFVLTLAGCEGSNGVTQGTDVVSNRSDEGLTAEGLPVDLFPSVSNTNVVKLNRWMIRYPKSLKQNIRMSDNSLTIEFSEFLFELRDNSVAIDSTDYGRVSEGDEVLIGFTGRIAVNGRVRSPQATPDNEVEATQ